MHPPFRVDVNRGQQIPQRVMRSPPPLDLGKVSRPRTGPDSKAEPEPGMRTSFAIYTFSNTIEINVE